MSSTQTTNNSNPPPPLGFLVGTNAQLIHMPVGAFVFRENEGCGRVGFVKSGSIRVFKDHLSGRAITLYRLGAGDACALSMSCALYNPIHQASAIVEEDAMVYTLSVEEFHHLLDKNREARDFVFTSFASRLSDTMLLIEEVVFQRMEERLAAIILEHGIRHKTDVITITHEQLADEIGTVREVVTRILHDFANRGFVQLSRGKLSILDRRGLAKAITHPNTTTHA